VASIFSRIVAGEIPCHKIAETADFLAFLDVNPRVRGHVLVIPKREIDYIFDVDDDSLGAMMVFAKRVARAIQAVVPCQRIGVAVIGLEVPHAHIHLIPVNQVTDVNFERAPIVVSSSELASLASSISASYHG
jgi:histidine triad (HIT) family protein